MSPEDKQRLEDILNTFASQGWKHLAEELNETAVQLNTIHNVNDEQTLFRNKGKLDVLSMILGYEEVARRIIDEEDL